MRRLFAVLLVLGCVAGVIPAAAAVDSSRAAPPKYRLSHTFTEGGKPTIMRWDPCRPISYRIDTRYLPVSQARKRRAAADVRTGFVQLAAATGLALQEVPAPPDMRLPTMSSWWRGPRDTVTVTFMRPSRRGQATSFLPIDRRTGTRFGGYARWNTVLGRTPTGTTVGRIYTATIALNADEYVRYPWGYRDGKASGSLILHELGHAAGLLHVQDPTQVMYGGFINRSRHRAAYQSGDLAGLRLLGATRGCVS